MTIRYSRSEWQQHLDAWQQSGMSKKHYYRLHDMNIATDSLADLAQQPEQRAAALR